MATIGPVENMDADYQYALRRRKRAEWVALAAGVAPAVAVDSRSKSSTDVELARKIARVADSLQAEAEARFGPFE